MSVEPVAAIKHSSRSSRILTILICLVPIAIFVAFVVSNFNGDTGSAARRTMCKSHLKQIGLALHNYHAEYGSFPPAYVADANGRPMHSWRVLLLPFVDETGLYEEYRFDESWNGPNNIQLADRIPEIYRCPGFVHHQEHLGNSDVDAYHLTNYVAISGVGTAFDGSKALSLKFLVTADGSTYTMLIGEVSRQAVHWMSPNDVTGPEISTFLKFVDDDELNHSGGAHFLFADGSVKFITRRIPRTTFDALTTIDGGEIVKEF